MYVVVKIGRDGKVEDAAIERVNLTVVASEGDLVTYREWLSRATLQAARRWQFLVPTAGPDKDRPFWQTRVPVAYTLLGDKRYGYGQWQPYVPGPKQDVPWRDAGADNSTNDAQIPGTLQPLGSRGLKLLTKPDAG